jgi:hypothetical protein
MPIIPKPRRPGASLLHALTGNQSANKPVSERSSFRLLENTNLNENPMSSNERTRLRMQGPSNDYSNSKNLNKQDSGFQNQDSQQLRNIWSTAFGIESYSRQSF